MLSTRRREDAKGKDRKIKLVLRCKRFRSEMLVTLSSSSRLSAFALDFSSASSAVNDLKGYTCVERVVALPIA